MKLSAPQQLALKVVALRKQRLDDDRRAAELAVRAELASRTALARAEYERAVVEADRAGVPKSQIALAVGTSNPKPIREIVRRAARTRVATSGSYAKGDRPETLLIRLEGEDLASACEATGWTVVEAVNGGVDRAVFTVTSGLTLLAETDSYVSEAGRLHPVVAYTRRDPSAALAWWMETR